MSRATGNKSAAPKNGSPMLTGILLGMVVGVALAAGLAWFILKSPSPFVNKEQVVMKPPVETLKPAVEVARPAAEVARPRVDAASGVEEGRPRFEFYKVLTDKQDAPSDAQSKSADKPKATEAKPAIKTAYLQAGAFTSVADAENLKAKVTLLGMDVNIQAVTLPKGVMHRVRIGPFQNDQEKNKALGTLKLNGIDATPVP